MKTSADKSTKKEWLRAWLDFIFGFRNRRGTVQDGWLASADGFTGSAQDFYGAIEGQVASRKLPGVAIRRERFAEGGLLSGERTYLRLMRERIAIDTCAAPFGGIFFFSCRTVHIPALVRLWHIAAAILFFCVVDGLFIKLLGPTFALIAVIALVFAIVGVLRNAAKTALADLDTLLLTIPVVATIYEDWFREDTYYRQDTRQLYTQLLPQMIKEIAEETCAGKGVKLQSRDANITTLPDLFKPLPPEKAATPP
jgi:hypothetical protein